MTHRPGFRIRDSWVRPDPEVVASFAVLPTPNIADAMNRLGVVGNGIHAVWPGARCAGPALTTWTRAGDNLMIHKAIDMAAPGDVLIVNGQGDRTRALFGDLMGQTASVLGIAGLVFDGAVRDTERLAELTLPVFARGVSAAGPFKNGPGEIGFPVACGGVVCNPGDIVVGDGDGVVIVPAMDAEAVLSDAISISSRELRRREEILNGSPRRSGIDEELVRLGVLEEA